MLLKIETVKTIPDPAHMRQLRHILNGMLHGVDLRKEINDRGIEEVRKAATSSPSVFSPFTRQCVHEVWGKRISPIALYGRDDVQFTLIVDHGLEKPDIIRGFSIWKITKDHLLCPLFLGVDRNIAPCGIGTRIVRELLRIADADGLTLQIGAAINAIGFYMRFGRFKFDKLGFDPCITSGGRYVCPGSTYVYEEYVRSSLGLTDRIHLNRGRELFNVFLLALPNPAKLSDSFPNL